MNKKRNCIIQMRVFFSEVNDAKIIKTVIDYFKPKQFCLVKVSVFGKTVRVPVTCHWPHRVCVEECACHPNGW